MVARHQAALQAPPQPPVVPVEAKARIFTQAGQAVKQDVVSQEYETGKGAASNT